MDSAPKVSVPDIMDNSSLRQAEAKLRALGFRVTEPEYISGEKTGYTVSLIKAVP